MKEKHRGSSRLNKLQLNSNVRKLQDRPKLKEYRQKPRDKNRSVRDKQKLKDRQKLRDRLKSKDKSKNVKGKLRLIDKLLNKRDFKMKRLKEKLKNSRE